MSQLVVVAFSYLNMLTYEAEELLFYLLKSIYDHHSITVTYGP